MSESGRYSPSDAGWVAQRPHWLGVSLSIAKPLRSRKAYGVSLTGAGSTLLVKMERYPPVRGTPILLAKSKSSPSDFRAECRYAATSCENGCFCFQQN